MTRAGQHHDRRRMTKLSVVWICVLSLLVGCGKKRGGDDCVSTVSGVIDRITAEETKGDTDVAGVEMIKTLMPKVKAAMMRSCTYDKWPAEALECMGTAKTNRELEACNAKLTPAQRANAEKAVAEVMSGELPVPKPDDKPDDKPTQGASIGSCNLIAALSMCMEFSSGEAATEKEGCEGEKGTWSADACPTQDLLGSCTNPAQANATMKLYKGKLKDAAEAKTAMCADKDDTFMAAP